MNTINWEVEHERFMTIASPSHPEERRSELSGIGMSNKRDDAIQECMAKDVGSVEPCSASSGQEPRDTMIGIA